MSAVKERVIERVELERGLQPAQTEARIRAQLSDDERRKHATEVIINDGTIADLRKKVAKLWDAALAQTG